MTNQPFVAPITSNGPLSPYIKRFTVFLLEQGYVKDTVQLKIQLVAKLNDWLHRRRLGVRYLNEKIVVKFLKHKYRRDYIRQGYQATLRLLLNLLRNAGKIPIPVPKIDDSPIYRVESRFTEYLIKERQLSQATIKNTIPFVRQFLTKCFGTSSISLDELRPNDITKFILCYAHTLNTGRAKLMVTALRSFFRFLYLQGEIDTNLSLAVPTVPNWRMTSLPKSLESEQVEHLLKSCNQNTTKGYRNYAIMLLLARLGLRAIEIVTMTLDDIDWEAGEFTVRGKGGLQDRLPIPPDVGNALVRYLEHGRPHCSTRRVFVCLRAPRKGFSNSSDVCSIVSRALTRAGLNPSHRGAHLLRHSLAVRMLHNKASLAEVGEILRHRSLSTTEIYAKVDLMTLRSLAQLWPGGKL